MKRVSKLLFPLLMCMILISCNSKPAKIDYIPVKVESNRDRWTLMNEKGQTIEDDFKGKPSLVVNDVFYVRKSNKGTCTLYKISGKKAVEIPGMSDLASVEGYYSEGVIPVQKKQDGKIEFVDLKGKTKFSLPKEITVAGIFADGLMLVYKYDENYYAQYGFINTKGETAIPMKYSSARMFNEGYAPVESNDKWMIIDTKGKKVADMKDVRAVGSPMMNGLISVVKDDATYGLMNKKGEFTKFKYEIKAFNGDYAIVYDGDDCGVCDTKGQKIIDCKYNTISFLGTDKFLCQVDREEWVVLDKNAKEVYKINEDQAISLKGVDAYLSGDFLIVGEYKHYNLANISNGKAIEDTRFADYKI